jgi:cytochrome c oxidase assembly factor CtaG
MSPQTWYRSYSSAEDQSLGGLVMWGIGGAVDMLAVLILIGRYLVSQERAAPDPSHEGAGARVSRP